MPVSGSQQSRASRTAGVGDGGRDARGLRTSDFDYALPEELIARRPAARRDASRLLVVDRARETLVDARFPDLVDHLTPGDALVLNDTRVFPARIFGRKPTGADVEVLLLGPLADTGPMRSRLPGRGFTDPGLTGAGREGSGVPETAAADARLWEAIVRPGAKLKPGRMVDVAPGFRLRVEDSLEGGRRVVRLEGDGDPWDLIERHGTVPLPPYLGREPEPADRDRYQTVYASRTGSAAAPTAGLHFTPELLERVERRGVHLVRITLHVGLGTFRPVEVERPHEHVLHAERYRVESRAAATLNAAREAGGRVCAVGTTSVRTLETVVDGAGRFRPGEGATDLFIRPGFRFRGVDALLTNFHLPRSSLLMLVAAFAGLERVREAYRHAIERRYRFYSYGDAMLIE